MDTLKEAFNKIKQDIDFLNNKVNSLSANLSKTREDLSDICEILKEFNLVNQKLDKQAELFSEQNKNINELLKVIFSFIERENLKEKDLNVSTSNLILTNSPANSNNNSAIPTYKPADNSFITPLNGQILGISNGNEGVQTDRQTNQQTNQQTDFTLKKEFLQDSTFKKIDYKSSYNNKEFLIDNAANILDSLDGLKKEIRLKFKRLTDQELTVFSAIYQLDEENGSSDYKMLSKRLNLTESSIRDYTCRLIKKGIPINKVKINNKQIQLNISSSLKKIATLNTILQLRDI
jgi:hypothetical protein